MAHRLHRLPRVRVPSSSICVESVKSVGQEHYAPQLTQLTPSSSAILVDLCRVCEICGSRVLRPTDYTDYPLFNFTALHAVMNLRNLWVKQSEVPDVRHEIVGSLNP